MGTRVGHLELIDRVSSSPEAELWQAAGPGRVVALKLERAGAAEGARRAIEREAALLRAAPTPALCQLEASGQSEGRKWLAIEWIDGLDLGSVVGRVGDRLRLDPELAAHIVGELAAAVDALHHARIEGVAPHGLLHGALEPWAVRLATDGRVRLTDMSRFRSLDTLGHAAVPCDTIAVRYAAPEQLRAEGEDVRTEVFALGLVLLELATGEPAYASLEQGEDEIVTADIRTANVVPPTFRLPEFPIELELICMRALSPTPEQRFQTAAELAEALRTFAMAEDPTVGPRTVATLVGDLREGAPIVRGATRFNLEGDVRIAQSLALIARTDSDTTTGLAATDNGAGLDAQSGVAAAEDAFAVSGERTVISAVAELAEEGAALIELQPDEVMEEVASEPVAAAPPVPAEIWPEGQGYRSDGTPIPGHRTDVDPEAEEQTADRQTAQRRIERLHGHCRDWLRQAVSAAIGWIAVGLRLLRTAPVRFFVGRGRIRYLVPAGAAALAIAGIFMVLSRPAVSSAPLRPAASASTDRATAEFVEAALPVGDPPAAHPVQDPPAALPVQDPPAPAQVARPAVEPERSTSATSASVTRAQPAARPRPARAEQHLSPVPGTRATAPLHRAAPVRAPASAPTKRRAHSFPTLPSLSLGPSGPGTVIAFGPHLNPWERQHVDA